MIPTVPFKEAYFLEDALKFREALPGAPLIYVGGLVSREKLMRCWMPALMLFNGTCPAE